jgi:hypothetical protein
MASRLAAIVAGLLEQFAAAAAKTVSRTEQAAVADIADVSSVWPGVASTSKCSRFGDVHRIAAAQDG